MSALDRLHPAVQHHVVNSFGWRELRPLQEAAIEPLLAGENALLLAPTAGGKTEAAVLPLVSRMATEDWHGLSVLYVCPIKALLNNLEPRLTKMTAFVGRRAAVWHGDVGQRDRKAILRERPDVLLTTPESLEALLIFRKEERNVLFGELKAVVVDELHAFAGDDRGWHLLSVLARLQRISGAEFQRIGCSATVGNPEALLAWLSAGSTRPRRVVNPPSEAPAAPDLLLDYVGSVENAALVISRLHRGEKRLVFCDSRSRVEALGSELRRLGASTFVSHSSLSADERRRAEAAFSEGQDCVIVATSTLELGIDVGDLDRVLQLDAPWTAASVLQRMGRTGRRPGTRRNYLFLTTDDDAFLRAAGLLHLLAQGYVEPVEPPPLPYHVFAHQVLALVLSEGRLVRHEWGGWIGSVPAFAEMSAADRDGILDYMVAQGFLSDEGGLLSIGPESERRYGGYNYLDLCAVFSSPPLVQVFHGRQEIGQVHETSFQTTGEGPKAIALAGRSWTVRHVDWNRKTAHVEPAPSGGKSRWLGGAQPMSFALASAIERVLLGDDQGSVLTKRASDALAALRQEFRWHAAGSTTLHMEPSRECGWWTFAGGRANRTLADRLALRGVLDPRATDLCVTVRATELGQPFGVLVDRVEESATDASPCPTRSPNGPPLKFAECLPAAQLSALRAARGADQAALAAVAQKPVRAVVAIQPEEG